MTIIELLENECKRLEELLKSTTDDKMIEWIAMRLAIVKQKIKELKNFKDEI